MKPICKLLCSLAALAALTFAAATHAAKPVDSGNQKSFFLTMSPTSTTMTATWTNTATGNSYINSMKLVPPFTIVGVEVPANLRTQNTVVSPQCSVATPCPAGSEISVSNITGIGPGTSNFLTLTLASAVSPVCNATSTWTAFAYTGNAFGGTTFVDDKIRTQPFSTADSTLECKLVFKTQPANAENGKKITSVVNDESGTPVEVDVMAGGSVVTSFNGPITLTRNGGTGTLAYAPTSATAGKVVYTTLSLDALGTYTLTATDPGGTYTSATSNAFTIFDGVLDCQPSPPFEFGSVGDDEDQSGYAAGLRWFWNKDGLNCVPLLYTFDNYILSSDPNLKNKVHLAWDTTAGQHPSFMYSATFLAEDVDNPNKGADSLGPSNYGWPVPRRSYVAFNTVGGPQFVPGLACISNTLPSPYARLAASIDAVTTSVVVSVPPSGIPTYEDPNNPGSFLPYPTATFPSTTPFPIVIGTERILVTAVSGNTLTVQRHAGGTSAAAHDAGAFVMSTPLPLDPATNLQVPMCIVRHGWVAAGLNPVSGIPQIRWFTTVFDLGDGWVRIGQ